MQTLGSAAIGVGIGLGILVAGFIVSNITLGATPVVATTTGTSIPIPLATRAASPTAASTASAPVSASPARIPTPAPTPTPTPTVTPDPLVVTAYSGQGLRLAALTIPSGYTVNSPIGGRVTVAFYQFVDGEIRSGVDGVPSYPYIFVRSADREIKLRPGAVDRDVQLLVKDGDLIAAGQALFKTVSAGASSWKTFYDSAVNAQVLVSATAQPAGTEVDPVPLFKR